MRSLKSCLFAALLLPLSLGVVRAQEPIATVPTNFEGITLYLMKVRRKGNVLTVKWAIKNESSKESRYRFVFTGKDPCYVLDEENGTKYFVLTDKEKQAIASGNAWVSSDQNGVKDKIGAGKTLRFWMKLPAPPPEIKEIGIYLTGTEPMDEIKIEDASP